MSFFSEIQKYSKKKLHSDFAFTKAYLYAKVGQILFLKPCKLFLIFVDIGS